MFPALLVIVLLGVSQGIPQKRTKETVVAPSCDIVTGETGQCMPRENCNLVLPTDEEYKTQWSCFSLTTYFPIYLYRHLSFVLQFTRLPNSSPVSPTGQYVDSCLSKWEICCPDDMLNFSPRSEPQRTVCGQRNPSGLESRILSDDLAHFGEFPWMVVVLKDVPVDVENPNGRKFLYYLCSGSLIHPGVVLTTNHHIQKNYTLSVRAGELDISTTAEPYSHQSRAVERVIQHELYNNQIKSVHYDIALLILDSPMELAPNVGTVCLPPPGQVAPEGTRCLSSGWGKNKYNKGVYQRKMRKVEVPVVGRNTCQNILRTSRLGQHFRLHETFMCAGGESGKDTCTGDGGSPLVCPIPSLNNRYMQHGMVAWGIGCGGHYPGVYVDVAFLRPWIDEKMEEVGLQTDTYTF